MVYVYCIFIYFFGICLKTETQVKSSPVPSVVRIPATSEIIVQSSSPTTSTTSSTAQQQPITKITTQCSSSSSLSSPSSQQPTTQPQQRVQFIRQPKQQSPQLILSSARSSASSISGNNSNNVINSTVVKTLTVPTGTLSGPGQTIVVTQGGGRPGTLIRNGTATILKQGSSGNTRSLLLPVNQGSMVR